MGITVTGIGRHCTLRQDIAPQLSTRRETKCRAPEAGFFVVSFRMPVNLNNIGSGCPKSPHSPDRRKYFRPTKQLPLRRTKKKRHGRVRTYAAVSFSSQTGATLSLPVLGEALGPVILGLFRFLVVPYLPFLGTVYLEPLVLFPLLPWLCFRLFLRLWRRGLFFLRDCGVVPCCLWLGAKKSGNVHIHGCVQMIR